MKQRSPAVWAKVKDAYLAGEPAASVARRFDVGVGNLRFRANKEGWTRKAQLQAEVVEEAAEQTRLEGRADPEAAPPLQYDDGRCPSALLRHLSAEDHLREGLRLAARRIAEGRAQEGEALVKAARALADSTSSQLPTMEQLEGSFVGGLEALARAVEYRAWGVATSLHKLEPDPPAGSEVFYFHLRDRYGRGADGDRRWVTEHRPELAHLWDAEGRVPAPPEPDDEAVKIIVAVLATGLRLRRDGHLRTWVAEAARDAERQASAL